MLGIIGAMAEEIELIKKNIDQLEVHEIGDIIFLKGTINKQDIILCQSGIGKVNAAFATTLLIYHFQVKGILFSGVAGGVKPELNINDLVIGTDFLYHDVDATALGYQMSELPDGYLSLFKADPVFSNVIHNISIELFGENKVFEGRIISGDQFIASYNKIQEFQSFYDAYAVDMESAAVAHIANKSKIPCCIIRSISDKADGQANEIYEEFFRNAAEKSAQIVVGLYQNYNINELF